MGLATFALYVELVFQNIHLIVSIDNKYSHYCYILCNNTISMLLRNSRTERFLAVSGERQSHSNSVHIRTEQIDKALYRQLCKEKWKRKWKIKIDQLNIWDWCHGNVERRGGSRITFTATTVLPSPFELVHCEKLDEKTKKRERWERQWMAAVFQR